MQDVDFKLYLRFKSQLSRNNFLCEPFEILHLSIPIGILSNGTVQFFIEVMY